MASGWRVRKKMTRIAIAAFAMFAVTTSPAFSEAFYAGSCYAAADAIDVRARTIRAVLLSMQKPLESSNLAFPENVSSLDEKAEPRLQNAIKALHAHLRDLEDLSYQLRLCGRE
jgi:hypothetical protein